MSHYILWNLLHELHASGPESSLVAAATAAIAVSPRLRDQRARGKQSFSGWIHFAGRYSSLQ